MTTEIAAAEVAELLSALIKNRCVNDGSADSGHEERSVATLEDYLGEPGERFEKRPARASVVYRLPGTDPDAPSLMLMGHTDVVPVSRDGWTVDPFAGERSEGFVWGRGAVDMLNQTAAMAAVFKRYLDGEAAPLAATSCFSRLPTRKPQGSSGPSGLSRSTGIRCVATTC